MIRNMTVFLLCVCLGGASSCAVAAMDGYFAACASCRSELLDAQAYGSRVSVIEQASWRVNDEERSQSSIAVYEFTGDLIARVYYFPAE